MNIGQRIMAIRGTTSRKDFSKKVSIVENTLRNYEENLSLPNSDVIAKICNEYHINSEWLIFGKGEITSNNSTSQDLSNIFYVPKVEAKLSAGQGSLETSAIPESSVPFSRAWLQNKGNLSKMVLMQVSGDSMVPEIYDHDFVLLDQSKVEIQVGKIFAVGFEDAIYVKKIDILPKTIVLSSSNEKYPPIHININDDTSNQFRIIGKVIWICREYR